MCSTGTATSAAFLCLAVLRAWFPLLYWGNISLNALCHFEMPRRKAPSSRLPNFVPYHHHHIPALQIVLVIYAGNYRCADVRTFCCEIRYGTVPVRVRYQFYGHQVVRKIYSALWYRTGRYMPPSDTGIFIPSDIFSDHPCQSSCPITTPMLAIRDRIG